MAGKLAISSMSADKMNNFAIYKFMSIPILNLLEGSLRISMSMIQLQIVPL